MGFSWQYMKKIEQHGLIRPGMKLLDIGSSNLYSADAEELEAFIKRYKPDCSESETKETADRLATGSTYVVGKGGTNDAFLGELIDAAGLEYWSFDIADGYKTEILDFNTQSLPDHHRNAWDLVLNFGTTEHVFDQLNSFKIIHEATKVGGTIFHQLPSVGYIDHCYFNYSAPFFFELAKRNRYRLVDFWYDGPGPPIDLNRSAKAYKRQFPFLKDYLKSEPSAALDRLQVPDISIDVILEKTSDAPFVGEVEK